eukprot:scaffold391321_cov22-Prasinocladus_malaysianus.AAC.1
MIIKGISCERMCLDDHNLPAVQGKFQLETSALVMCLLSGASVQQPQMVAACATLECLTMPLGWINECRWLVNKWPKSHNNAKLWADSQDPGRKQAGPGPVTHLEQDMNPTAQTRRIAPLCRASLSTSRRLDCVGVRQADQWAAGLSWSECQTGADVRVIKSSRKIIASSNANQTRDPIDILPGYMEQIP